MENDDCDINHKGNVCMKLKLSFSQTERQGERQWLVFSKGYRFTLVSDYSTSNVMNMFKVVFHERGTKIPELVTD